MVVRCRNLLFCLLAILVVLTAGLWLAREPLLQTVLRPWLAGQASQALNGEVVIDQLVFEWGRLELRGLRLARKDIDARIDALRLVFTIDGLLQSRLEELVVVRPDAELRIPAMAAEPDAPPSILPRLAPLEVTAWTVMDGRLRATSGAESYVVRDIAASGGFGKVLRFASSARVGSGEGIAVSLSGGGRWHDGLELTFEELAWGDRSLLSKPVTVRPGETGELAVTVTLPSLDDVEVAALLSAFGRPVPWPEGLQWRVTAPAAALRLVAGQPVLRVSLGAGVVNYAARDWPWASADVGLRQADKAWRVDALLGFAAGGQAAVKGIWSDDVFKGQLESVAPQPAAMAATFGILLPVEARKARNLALSARVHASRQQAGMSEGQLSFDWPRLGKIAARFHGDWRAGKVTAKVDGATLTAQPEMSPLATAVLDLAGDPAAGRWQGRWQLAADDLLALARAAGVDTSDQLPGLRGFSLSGRLKLDGDQLTLAEVALTGRVAGAGLSGRLAGRLDAAHHAQHGLSIDLRELVLAEVEYSNADGTVVAAGGRLTLAGQVRQAAEAVSFDLQGRATLDEALAGSWYGSLQDLPLGFTARGRWSPVEQVAQLELAGFNLDGLVTAELAGQLSTRAMALDGQLSIKTLSGRFLAILQRLGGEIAPALRDLELGGALTVQAGVLREKAAWRLDMEVKPDGVKIGLRDSATFSGLRGSLPVIVQSGDLPGAAPERSGRLSWTGLAAPMVETTDGHLELQATANRWQLVRPVTVAAAGGRVGLNALQLSWQDFSPAGEAALSIEDVELAQVSRAFDGPELGGRFSAALDGIRFTTEAIVTSGEASAQAFGGVIRLHNLKILAPLSRFPTYHADIDFSDLNLQELTRTFAFGEINGVASGHVRGLRLFDGIPSAFDARFETAEAGTRNISVKAIRNLNTLSHGGLSAALSQGVYRFIDFYRYRKIGLSCTLLNDVFRLQGTARDDSTQYLIDGGWLPPKIDVIVSSPVISFKEMVKRLKRIERTER